MRKNNHLHHFSIVIITKNEERVLERTLASVQGITDDLIIIDSGSTDNTLDIARKYSAQILETEWLGYGPTKNLGSQMAKYKWILSLDADEAIDGILRRSLLNPLAYNNSCIAYDLRIKIFIGDKYLRYGQWLNRHNIKLFNKEFVRWNDALVHEMLIVPPGYKVNKLLGNVLHYTSATFSDHVIKQHKYALLSARKYFITGKKNTWYKLYFTPPFTFILNYIFKLGFLDGWQGFVSARLSAYYSFLKYTYLEEIINTTKNNHDGPRK